jgi:oligopeptide/dipeptide ABC transporter ATP-binding protein
VQFAARPHPITPVRDISFDVNAGQRLGLVGESGSGKSLTALALMRLIKAPGRIAGGEVRLAGRDLLQLKEREMAAVRGRQIAMVYQNPLSALNPVRTIGQQLVEAIRLHHDVDRRAARERAIDLLDQVGVPTPAERVDSYPHQFSGGMLQRVVIAMALCCDPELVIADEATTALDVTTQARIIELLLRLVEERGAAILFITHDLGVAAALCQDVQVMYAGRIVERAPVEALFESPQHPYTQGLIDSVPRLDHSADRLVGIPGEPFDRHSRPTGCPFAPRCAVHTEVCLTDIPSLDASGERRWVACHHAEGKEVGA